MDRPPLREEGHADTMMLLCLDSDGVDDTGPRSSAPSSTSCATAWAGKTKDWPLWCPWQTQLSPIGAPSEQPTSQVEVLLSRLHGRVSLRCIVKELLALNSAETLAPLLNVNELLRGDLLESLAARRRDAAAFEHTSQVLDKRIDELLAIIERHPSGDLISPAVLDRIKKDM